MWSNDYPHPVSSWPESRAIVERQFVGVPDVERDLIVAGNDILSMAERGLM